jgi:hypothetical protein
VREREIGRAKDSEREREREMRLISPFSVAMKILVTMIRNLTNCYTDGTLPCTSAANASIVTMTYLAHRPWYAIVNYDSSMKDGAKSLQIP